MEQIISLQITNYLWKINNKTSIADLKIVVLYNRTIIIVELVKLRKESATHPAPTKNGAPVILSPANTRLPRGTMVYFPTVASREFGTTPMLRRNSMYFIWGFLRPLTAYITQTKCDVKKI